MFRDPLTARIAAFLNGIGLAVRAGDISQNTFLPGLRIEQGVLVVDPSRLLYPGDLLHEAGHLAVTAGAERAAMRDDVGPDGGAEMAAIAWSYAAVRAMGLEVEVLFHAEGYKGGSAALIENFAAGRWIGVPLLEWYGMTSAGEYPAMRRWLRG